MRFKRIAIILLFSTAAPSFAQNVEDIRHLLQVQTEDGGTILRPNKLVFPSGSMTNNGDGSVTIETGSGSGGSEVYPATATVNLDVGFAASTGSFTSVRESASGVIDRTVIIQAVTSLGSNEVYANAYSILTDTGTTDNTGNAAHAISALHIASNTPTAGSDIIAHEARLNARSTITNVEQTAGLNFVAGKATGNVNGVIWIGGTDRVCIATNDTDCGTDNNTGTVYARQIKDIEGGAFGSNFALRQEGQDDFNFLAGSHTYFANTYSSAAAVGSRVTVVQPGGAAVTSALRLLSGGSADYTYMGIGRITDDYWLGASAATDQFFQGNIAGDSFIGAVNTANDLAFGVGFNALPELRISNEAVLISTAGSFAVPQQTNPTVDAPGEFAVDTSSGQIVVSTAASSAVVMLYGDSKEYTFTAPTAGMYPTWFKPRNDITVDRLVCLSSAATSATIEVRECNANGASCTAINTAAACGTTETALTLTDTAIAAGNRVRIMVTAVSGSTGFTEVDLYYRETRK